MRVIRGEWAVLWLERDIALGLRKGLIRTRRLVPPGVREARIALTEIRVGDLGIDAVVEGVLHIGFARVARIGRQLHLLKNVR